MFQQLTDKLNSTLKNIRGLGKLTAKNIEDTLQELRNTLLEADVALPVVKSFLQQVKEAAIGQEISGKINPGEAFMKIVNQELITLMGAESVEINLKQQPPVVIMVCGLQGSGKTTSLAKLAAWLRQEHGKEKIMLVSADTYRPAAREQLATLATQVQAEYLAVATAKTPQQIVQQALEVAKSQHAEVLLVDTAGRLNIDQQLMEELKQLHTICTPAETLLVLDAMTGQESANIATEFAKYVDITGVVLTKADGDARGGAALSVPSLLGKPIKFLGVGEKIDALEKFHPKRMASRILGMGDLAGLLESAEKKIDQDKSKNIFKKGKRFDLNSFLDQLLQFKKMGGMQKILSKLPSNMLPPEAKMAGNKMMDDKKIKSMQAMIQSMTLHERSFPATINGSRKRRIAAGSGHEIVDVNKLLKQFTQMQKQLKKFKGGKMQKQLKRMGGKLPNQGDLGDLF